MHAQATLLAEKHGLKVCIIDPNLEKRWIPNYGVWVEEWEALDKDLQVLYITWYATVLYFAVPLPTFEWTWGWFAGTSRMPGCCLLPSS